MPGALIPINEAERLAALYSYRILDTACEDSFDTIAWLAARLTASPIALVTLVDEHRQWFKARAGLEVSETHRDQAFCAHAILARHSRWLSAMPPRMPGLPIMRS